MPIYLFRAKLGQEKSLAKMVMLKGNRKDSGVYAVLLSDEYRGYAFIEGETQLKIEASLNGIRTLSARAIQNKEVPIEELEKILNPRPSIEGLKVGIIVQIIDGPFKGLKGRLTRVEENNQEITVELIDSTMSLPVKIHADYVKKIREDSDYGKYAL